MSNDFFFLLSAIQLGSVPYVARLLSEGADPNAADEVGASLLHHVARAPYMVRDDSTGQIDRERSISLALEILGLLLEKGAEINATDINGDTPLISAASERVTATVHFLLQHGADIRHRNNSWQTALWQASAFRLCGESLLKYEDNLPVLRLLADAGADLDTPDSNGDTPLMAAIDRGCGAHVQFLVGRGAQLTIPAEVAQTRKHLRLLCLSLGGDCPAFRGALARAPAHRVEETGGCERTAFSFAAERGDLATLRLLIARGARMDSQSSMGLFEWTPLIFAIYGGHTECVELLLDQGAGRDFVLPQTTEPSSGGQGNALYWAAKLSASAYHDGCPERAVKEEIVALLLAYGIELREDRGGPQNNLLAQARMSSVIREKYWRGMTVPLIPAILAGANDIALALIAAGADVLEPLTAALAAQTPLNAAASRGSLEVVEALLGAGAPPDPPARARRTPLMSAVLEGHLEVAARLLAAGADPGRRNYEGKSALELAEQTGQNDVLRVLLEDAQAGT